MEIYKPVENEYSEALQNIAFSALKRGVIRGIGADRLDLLHRLSTGEVGNLKPGQEGTTVLTSEKGRIIEVLRVVAQEDSALILLTGNNVEEVRSWLDKYTIMDDFETVDVSDEYQVLTLHGLNVSSLLQKLFSVSLPENGLSVQVEVEGQSVVILRDIGLSGPNGGILLLPSSLSSKISQLLTDAGAYEMSDQTWQTLRVEAGRPEFGAELSEEFNPLEAGLVSHVLFYKRVLYRPGSDCTT